MFNHSFKTTAPVAILNETDILSQEAFSSADICQLKKRYIPLHNSAEANRLQEGTNPLLCFSTNAWHREQQEKHVTKTIKMSSWLFYQVM